MGEGDKLDEATAAMWPTILVLLLAFAVFAPSMSNGFTLDDKPLAGAEWNLQPGQLDPVIGTLHSPAFYFSKFYWWVEYVNDGLYRPLTIYTYALTYNLVSAPFFGRTAEAVPHHVLNVLLHVLATFLVLRLLLGVGLGRLAAHVGAGLFAVHAIHSEVVAGVVGRAELLAFVGGVAGILGFVRGASTTGGLRFAWYGGSALAFFGGYCSKESALAFAPLLVCVLIARSWAKRQDLRSVAFGPAAAVSLAPMGLFLLLRQNAISVHRVEMIDYVANPLWQADFLTRVCTAVKLWGYGLYQCFAPFDLSASYGVGVFDLSDSVLDFGFLASFLVLGGALAVALITGRRNPVVFLAVASFLGLGFITSNIPFATGTIFAERLYYAPSLGVCMFAAWGLERLHFHRWLWWGLSAWALTSVTVGLSRNGVWADNATLFLTESRNQPRSVDMQVKAAGVLRAAGGADDLAFEKLAEALRLVPGYPHALREKAALHMRRGEWDLAIESYQQAWESQYQELPSTREIAAAGLVAARRAKSVKIDVKNLDRDLARAVASVLAQPPR